MNKLVKTTALILAVVLMFFVFSSGKSYSRTYSMAAQVCEVNRVEDLVILLDGSGHEWAIRGVENWRNGDVVLLWMDDRGTENILDDEIVDIRFGFNPYYKQM